MLLNISDLANQFVAWFANWTVGDVVAVLVFLLAVSLALTAVKTALKITFAVVGIFAAIYLFVPDLFPSVWEYFNNLIVAILAVLQNAKSMV